MLSIRSSGSRGPNTALSCGRFLTVFRRCQSALSHSAARTFPLPGNRCQSGSKKPRAGGYLNGWCEVADLGWSSRLRGCSIAADPSLLLAGQVPDRGHLKGSCLGIATPGPDHQRREATIDDMGTEGPSSVPSVQSSATVEVPLPTDLRRARRRFDLRCGIEYRLRHRRGEGTVPVSAVQQNPVKVSRPWHATLDP